MSFSNGPKGIVGDGLVFTADAGNPQSYTSGSTDAYDIINSSITGSLINGMIYSTDGGGSWECDGTNDYGTGSPSGSTTNPTTVHPSDFEDPLTKYLQELLDGIFETEQLQEKTDAKSKS